MKRSGGRPVDTIFNAADSMPPWRTFHATG